MTNTYTRQEMVDRLTKYFAARGFDPREYYDQLGEIRLPLYCEKRRDDNSLEEEIVVDVITEANLSKEAYLPNKIIDGATVEYASSVTFFHYYLPNAKIFWAYGEYVSRDSSFSEFRKACANNGIGLIEIPVDKEVFVVEDAISLNELLTKQVEAEVNRMGDSRSQRAELVQSLSDLITRQSDQYILRLVYYGDPRFQRREITSRSTQDISMTLIDELEHLENLQYRDELLSLSKRYRTEARADYQVALDTIQSLWQSHLDIEYPDIHKDFEPVLLLDPRYRDHFLHQFQVFLLGAVLIDRLHDCDWVQSFEQSHSSKIELAWLAAATYHDFNYSIQTLESWMQEFFERNLHINRSLAVSGREHPDLKDVVKLNLENVVIRDEFLAKMGRLCTALGCDFDDCFLRFILRRVAVDRNHGVLGALTFLDKFQESNLLAKSAVDQTALSIPLHDQANWLCFCGKSNELPCCGSEEEKLSEKRLLPG